MDDIHSLFAEAGEQVADSPAPKPTIVDTEYTVAGTNIIVGSKMDKPPTYDHLPVGTYVAMFHPKLGYYLTIADKFEMPKKIYGNTTHRAKRFLDTFEQRSATTGVLLAGEKGSGKTLEMKLTSIEGLKRGISTIIVNSPMFGTDFNSFIQSIKDPIILIFDEFEKVYDNEQQEQLLTLLDGTFNSKKLCIFTCNDHYKINSHMINRPGRIFYYIKYKGLDEKFIVEYLEDNLKDKSKIDSVVRATSFFGSFNFDMLQSLTEEMNRYNESVKDALELLNIKVDYQNKVYYDVELYFQGEKVEIDKVYPEQVVNPLYMEQVIVTHYANEDDEDGSELQFEVTKAVANISRDLGRIETEVGDYRLVLKRPAPKTEYDYRGHL